MIIIACLHLCRSPCGIHLKQRFLISAASAANAVAVAAAFSAAAATFWGADRLTATRSERESGRIRPMYQSLQINLDWFEGEGDTGSRRFKPLRNQHHHAPVKVLYPPSRRIIKNCCG